MELVEYFQQEITKVKIIKKARKNKILHKKFIPNKL